MLRKLFILKCIDENNFTSYRDRFCVFANFYKNARVFLDMIVLNATTAFRSVQVLSILFAQDTFFISQRRDNIICIANVEKMSKFSQMSKNQIDVTSKVKVIRQNLVSQTSMNKINSQHSITIQTL